MVRDGAPVCLLSQPNSRLIRLSGAVSENPADVMGRS